MKIEMYKKLIMPVVKTIKTISALCKMLSESKKLILIVLACLLTISGIGFATPFLVESMVDRGIMKGDMQWLLIMGGILSFIYLIQLVIELLMEKNRIKLYNKINLKLEDIIAQHLSVIDISYYNDKSPTSIHSLLQEDIEMLSSVVDEDTFSLIVSFFSAICGIIALCIISLKLSFGLLFVILVQLLIGLIFTNKSVIFARNHRTAFVQIGKLFAELIGGNAELRIFGLCGSYQKRIHNTADDLLKQRGGLSMTTKVSAQFQSLVINLFTVIIYVIAGYLLQKGNISVGGIIAFQTYSLMALNPVIAGVQLIVGSASLVESYDHFRSFCEYPIEPSGDIQEMAYGDLSLRDVSFGYNSDHPIFDSIDVDFKVGSKTAIVGLNGTGKTTLLNIILKFLHPSSGVICLDDKDISTLNTAMYRSMFSVVSQDIFLFNGSIRDNICLGKEIPDYEFEEIVHLTNMVNLVKEKGDAYIIGEDGALLSGGQRQKVALARAIASNKKYLILDEATSSLDPETISVVNAMLRKKYPDRTIICVTHGNIDMSNFDAVWEIDRLGLKGVSCSEGSHC